MITLNVQLPETVAAEFYQAADELNQRFGDTKPRIDAKTLMAFALARHKFSEAPRLSSGNPKVNISFPSVVLFGILGRSVVKYTCTR